MRDGKLDVLVVTEGTAYRSEPFFAVFSADPAIAWMQAKQPRAQAFFNGRVGGLWDAYVFYDLPGVERRAGEAPTFTPPPADVVRGLDELADAGHGFVFLHHAAAAWPAWPGFERIVGGRFLLAPGAVGGRELPASGYRPTTTHRVTPVDASHPVVEGLAGGFTITDELYLMAVADDVQPLLVSDFPHEDVHFSSAELALAGRYGRREGWSHPAGTGVVGWTHRYRNSDVVYLQCGHGPSAYANPGFRRVLGNALRWVARHRPGGPALPYPL